MVETDTGDNRLNAIGPYNEADEARRLISAARKAREFEALNTMATIQDMADAGADDKRLGKFARERALTMEPLDRALAAAEDAEDALYKRGA